MGRQITFFSLVTVLISLIGVLGVVMFESEYRQKEIGIRKVFGASVRELLLMFNKTYLKISIVCFVIAVPLSYYFVQRWQESFIDKISLSWWIYMLAFLLVTTITLVTVSLQNWHVANVNPVDSIRSE
jgi:putative ABC transport system permease protein